MPSQLFFRGALASVCLLTATAVQAAFTTEIVFFDMPEDLEREVIPTPTAALSALNGYPNDPNQLTLAGQIYVPDVNAFDGPYPTVILLHGSGGMWSNDIIANGPLSHLEQWGELLADMGYIALLVDSYNPRGIPANYGSRRPSYDSAVDDDLCSPNYERPKDVVAALTYLAGRSDVDTDNIGLMGFSHGAQTAMNAVLDVSVDLGTYEVSYIDLVEIPDTDPEEYEEETTTKVVDSPVRIPDSLPFPKFGAFYYGGGSHYGYHGQASSVAAGRYMIDRRMQALVFHGTDDSLLGVSDSDVLPMTGNLYPIKQLASSSLQAQAEGVDDPLQHHYIMDHVEHSFDLETIADEIDWNTNAENADQKAKRLCREEVLKWLEYKLKPGPDTAVEPEPTPGLVELVASTNARLNYQWFYSDDLSNWNTLGSDFDGDDADMTTQTTLGPEDRRFFSLEYLPIEPPFDDPDNVGYFFDYADFSY
ncbi:dienelactone hydrolase family protein [Cerasicoccus maritimus]|uniref:dienelactone hydrolase family protein n=1 Tax=Cerasicoccus maritimus TaxID=490089 RepID=UPI0028526C54|nr:dienelactone hydrolase family protein [Cerasicoccus maritimus]